MNNEIQPFEFEGSQVRTAQDDNGNPLFCGTDVAQVLGYANPAKAVIDHCKGLPFWKPLETAGGIQQVRFISEGDMYRLITSSKLPAAERFEQWVYDEVLPSIRKHGAYMTESTLEKAVTEPDFLIRLATQIKQERAEKEKAQAQVERMRPKALFADAVETSKTSILVGDLAKVLKGNGVDIGGTRLFAWLRDNGWLMKTGSSRNMPTQKSMELGLFEIKETTVVHSDGHTTINKTPKVTGKGQTFFVNKFLGHREITINMEDV